MGHKVYANAYSDKYTRMRTLDDKAKIIKAEKKKKKKDTKEMKERAKKLEAYKGYT